MVETRIRRVILALAHQHLEVEHRPLRAAGDDPARLAVQPSFNLPDGTFDSVPHGMFDRPDEVGCRGRSVETNELDDLCIVRPADCVTDIANPQHALIPQSLEQCNQIKREALRELSERNREVGWRSAKCTSKGMV